jgi:hypothetical protein
MARPLLRTWPGSRDNGVQRACGEPNPALTVGCGTAFETASATTGIAS